MGHGADPWSEAVVGNRAPERIRSPARQDIQSGSDAEERIWSGSDRVPDFLIRWGQIDCEFSELSDGEIRPVRETGSEKPARRAGLSSIPLKRFGSDPRTPYGPAAHVCRT